VSVVAVLTDAEYVALRDLLVGGGVQDSAWSRLRILGPTARWTKWVQSSRVSLSLMLGAGLRVGEVCKLQWADMIVGEHCRGALELGAWQTKRGQARLVPLASWVRHVLESVWAWETFNFGSALEERDGRGCWSLCYGRVRSVQRWTAVVGRALKIDGLRPHVLRHTFATRLLAASDIKTVQELLGHRRLSSTQIYLHVNSAAAAAAVESI